MNQHNNLYGVFQNVGRNDRWGMTRNKRVAIREAKKHAGATVRVLQDCNETASYDAPTFRVLSEQIYPVAAPAVLPVAINYLHQQN